MAESTINDPAVRQSARRWIITPEGVALPVYLSARGERAIAFLIDQVIIILVLYLVQLLFGLVALESETQWIIAVQILLSFLIWTFYFAGFEIAWRGTTPGKRLLGLRVIDRRGGPLRTEAVVARNLSREVEVFVPFMVLIYGAISDPLVWFTMIWIFFFAFMPLFNRDRMRVGDLIAGTWVIDQGKTALKRDLAEAVPEETQGGAQRFRFTDKHLAVYGIYELQVLEDVLRRDDGGAADRRAAVAGSIRNKIDWEAPVAADEEAAFLESFYAALRAHLEKRMLFGDRRRDKFQAAEAAKSAPTKSSSS